MERLWVPMKSATARSRVRSGESFPPETSSVFRLGFRISGFNDRMYSNNDHADGRLTLYMYLEL